MLWRRHVDCLRHMESVELQDASGSPNHEIEPALGINKPSLRASLDTLYAPWSCRTSVNENWSFHGSSYNKIGNIVEFGFDHRVAKSQGFYGQGTYLASQSCKAHQYTCEHCGPGKLCRCRHARWMILARVALGSPYYARQTCHGMKRPPQRESGSQLHNSVVANPGPMKGHRKARQDHQEFVIFEGAQAYPCYVIKYTV